MKITMTKRDRKSERGIALLMAILALVLLSAIGLAMMYSANTETKVNANFRDKQIAVYAAQSGAFEARARLHPLNGDIVAPGGPPVAGVQNVIYIVNPGIGENA